MQNSRSRIVWFVAIALAFFFILDPFRLFESDSIPQMRVNQDIEREMIEFLATASEPTRYIVDSLASHDLVMIGESGYVKQQLEFLVDLIPALDAAGIRHLGFEYANSEDQDLIDELVTASSFDERLAERILFRHMTILGYAEHRAVFHSAWQVNRSKSDGEEPFRIIGVSHDLDYSLIVEQSDVEDQEVIGRVFAGGVPDEVMAETIMESIVEPGHRGVVYTKYEHAFTDFVQPRYGERLAEQGFPGQKRAGNILADRLGDRVMTVLFHMPLQDSRSRFGFGYPVGGLMEKAMEEVPQTVTSVGFDVAASPYADAPVTSNTITEGIEGDVTLQAFTDGYLIISPIAGYEPVTPIEGFITEENIAEARRQFPGPDPGEVTVEEMNSYISGTASSLARIFDEFE
jgi:hypothetical protein